jgi:hypothetical protein
MTSEARFGDRGARFKAPRDLLGHASFHFDSPRLEPAIVLAIADREIGWSPPRHSPKVSQSAADIAEQIDKFSDYFARGRNVSARSMRGNTGRLLSLSDVFPARRPMARPDTA